MSLSRSNSLSTILKLKTWFEHTANPPYSKKSSGCVAMGKRCNLSGLNDTDCLFVVEIGSWVATEGKELLAGAEELNSF